MGELVVLVVFQRGESRYPLSEYPWEEVRRSKSLEKRDKGGSGSPSPTKDVNVRDSVES